jgi:hypothetical protein
MEIRTLIIMLITIITIVILLTSPTSGGGSVGIVRSRTKHTEFIFLFFLIL